MSPLTWSQPLFLSALALLPSIGCGKGYDREIVLQLFRSRALSVDKVSVEASSAGQPVRAKVLDDPFSFDSCSTNFARIIPPQVDGTSVHIVVRANTSITEATIRIPAVNPVKLVLGGGPDLVPAGACSQGLAAPDAGPPPGDGAVDSTVLKKGLAEPCTLDGECAGGECLKTLATSPETTFSDGYCSRDCLSGTCSGGVCQAFVDGLGNAIGKYCLRSCSAQAPCPTSKLYCTPGSTCMPCTTSPCP